MAENMKTNKIIEYQSMFSCPICKTDIKVFEGKSLICRNNHCYDIAKQGYVNFASVNDNTYSAELFRYRNEVFEAGFYCPLADKLEEIIINYFDKKDTVILDAGCGEGYYIKKICHDSSYKKLAFDISKEAVKMASKGITDTAWMAADTGNIPIRDGCIDILLNILAPANYNEFKRVLKKSGIILKAVPGRLYLNELRMLIKNQLLNKEYDNLAIYEHFKNNTNFISKEKITYNMPVSYQQVVSFAKMTPMLSRIDINSLPLDKIRSMTIDIDIFIGSV